MNKNLSNEYYEEDGFPIKCPHCDGERFEQTVMDSIDVGVGTGYPCEIRYWCSNPECEEEVQYWAYGHFDPCFAEGLDVCGSPKMYEIEG